VLLKQCRERLDASIEELKKSGTGIYDEFQIPSQLYEIYDVKSAALALEEARKPPKEKAGGSEPKPQEKMDPSKVQFEYYSPDPFARRPSEKKR